MLLTFFCFMIQLWVIVSSNVSVCAQEKGWKGGAENSLKWRVTFAKTSLRNVSLASFKLADIIYTGKFWVLALCQLLKKVARHWPEWSSQFQWSHVSQSDRPGSEKCVSPGTGSYWGGSEAAAPTHKWKCSTLFLLFILTPVSILHTTLIKTTQQMWNVDVKIHIMLNLTYSPHNKTT